MKRIGVLAKTYQRAESMIRDDLFISGHDVVPLSSRTMGHRGREFDSIIVDSELWPSSELMKEFAPCLYASGGHFYVRY